MPDYSKTIIYKIVCRDLSILDIYVGHTTNFCKRKSQHKTACNNESELVRCYNYYVYQFIRDHGGWSNWDMIEICGIECVDKSDAARHERKYIEDLGATLNQNIPGRTIAEWYADNKEDQLEKKHIYYEGNKEVLLEKQKIYYIEVGKASRKKYKEDHLEEHIETRKQYRKRYTEKTSNYNKKYHADHREELLEKMRNRERLRRQQKKLATSI